MDPRYAMAYVSRGVAYGKLNRLEEAKADYIRAVELDPKLVHLKAFYDPSMEKEKTPDAQTGATDAGSGATAIDRKRGEALLERGNYEEAIAEFTRAIDLNPKDDEAYLQRGFAHGELGQNEKAIKDMRTAAKLGNQKARALLTKMGRAW